MYNPSHFVETRADVLAAAIERNPLATLVTLGPDARIDASHIPLLYFRDPGVLRGHMAKANPQWRDAIPSSEALAIFAGPSHYISPSWYAAKEDHGKVVPTWNYVVVHARGRIEFVHDPEWLLANVSALTDSQEGAREEPWSVDDAPSDYIQGLLKGIVGIEFTITSLEGKWKVSQNRGKADRESVAAAMAGLVRETLGE